MMSWGYDDGLDPDAMDEINNLQGQIQRLEGELIQSRGENEDLLYRVSGLESERDELLLELADIKRAYDDDVS